MRILTVNNRKTTASESTIVILTSGIWFYLLVLISAQPCRDPDLRRTIVWSLQSQNDCNSEFLNKSLIWKRQTPHAQVLSSLFFLSSRSLFFYNFVEWNVWGRAGLE
jgi:hypothetical protein